MATVGELLIRLGLDNRALALGLAESKGELAGFSTEVGRQSNAAASGFKAVQLAGAAVAAGSAAIAVESIHAASEFQEAMTTIAVNAHIPETAVRSLTTAIELAAIGTQASSLDMARALAPVAAEFERVTGRALNATDALLLLRAAENLSVAANTDLTSATKSITDLLLIYHLRASDAASISNLLFAGQAQLGIGVDILSNQLLRLQPRIAGAGLSLTQVLAIMREMEPVTGPGQRAILTLGAVLRDIVSPTQAAQKVLSALGVSLVDAQGNFIGFAPALAALQTALANVTPIQRNADLAALFGGNWKAARLLVEGGVPGLNANAAALNAQGTAASAAAQKNADLANQGRTLRQDLLDMAASIGGAFLPILSRFEATLIPIINSFAAWIATNPQLASNILLVAGAVGALVAATAYLGPAITLLLGPFGLVAAAVVGLGVAWATNWGGMRDIVSSVIAQIGPAIGGIIGFIHTIVDALTGPPTSAARMKEGVISNLQPLISFVQQVRDAFVTAFTFISTNVVPTLGQAFTWIQTNVIPALGQAFNWIRTNVLPPLGEAFGAVAGWVRDNWPLISSIVAQVAGAVRTAFLVIVNIIQFAWPILVGIGRVVFPIIGTAATILLNVLRGVFNVIGVIWQTAAIVAQSVAKTIGDVWNGVAGIFRAVSAAIGVAIGVAAGIIRGLVAVVQAVAAALASFFDWLTGKTAEAHRQVTGLAPGSPGTPQGGAGPGTGVGPGVPGFSYAPPTAPLPTSSYVPSYAGKPIPLYQTGGVVPGTGPMLAIVHGGETITPPGQGGQVIELHSHLSIGEHELGEVIERFMVRMAGVYSSGFQANSPVTGA